MGAVGGRLSVLSLCLLILFSGCLYPDIQQWGSEGIEVEVDKSAGTATLSQYSGDHELIDGTANLIGCDKFGNLSVDDPSLDKRVKIQGWLHLSKHFPDGPQSDYPGEIMSPSAVIIELSEYETADRPKEGKVEGVKWNTPVASVQARPPGFTNDDFPQMGWSIVGLIPANEDILEGFAGLDWHQPIALEGWLLDGQYLGHTEIHVSDDGECRIYAGNNNEGFSGYLLVTGMSLGNHGIIDAENNYQPYSVPLFGTWFYLLLVVASIGGAFVLFILTTGLVRRGARLSAKELMTEAQMLAAKGVKKEIARDFKRVQKETGEKVKVKTEKAKVIEAEVISEKPSVKLADFDVDEVLYSEHRPAAHSARVATSSGVVQTEEALDMVEQLEEMDAARELEEAMREAGGVMMPPHMGQVPRGEQGPSGNVAPAGSMMVTKDPQVGMSGPPKQAGGGVQAGQVAPEASRAPPGVKTRRAKKKAAEPEPEPEFKKPTKSGPDLADDEDFSDFSL